MYAINHISTRDDGGGFTYESQRSGSYHSSARGPTAVIWKEGISCHGQAGNLATGASMSTGDFSKMTTRVNFPLTSFQKIFTNVPAGSFKRTFNGAEYTSSDYSLQLSVGIRKYDNGQRLIRSLLEDSRRSRRKPQSVSKDDAISMILYVKALPRMNRGIVEFG